MAIQIGDRVAWKDRGQGVVTNFHGYYIGVAFDDEEDCYHDLGGRCKLGHGYYVPANELRIAEPQNISAPTRRREW